MAIYPPAQMRLFDPTINFSNDNVPIYDTGELPPKRHAACDECRQRKLKCSGELAGCNRCVKHGLLCHYSIQKQMGRPPKVKGASAAESRDFQNHSATVHGGLMEQLTCYSAPDPVGTYEAPQMSPETDGSVMMTAGDLRAGRFVTNEPIFESTDGSSLGTGAMPQWNPKQPDGYSKIQPPIISQALSSPHPRPRADSNTGYSPAGSFEPKEGATACSCLSQLYLCLSSLSTLSSSSPNSAQTLATLYNAARTARSVIHCATCPQAFGTKIQNLMMLGTLLAVAGDAWYRVSAMDAETLGNQTVCASYLASSVPADPTLRQEHWKQWLRNVVRHGVIGSPVAPAVHTIQTQCLDSLDLLSLIEELEDRQRACHNSQRKKDAKADSQTRNDIGRPAEDMREPTDERDYFCMRIIGNARHVIERFGFDPEELQERESRKRVRLGEDAFAAWTKVGTNLT